MPNLGSALSIAALGEGGASYEAEAKALFARFTTPPTGVRKSQINTLIKRLKVAGIWSRLDALWLYAAADAQAARQNWIADQYNITTVSSPTFTADRGYAGDGSAAYLRTGFIPSTAAKLAQDDAAHGLYVRNAGTSVSRFQAGCNDGTAAPNGYTAVFMSNAAVAQGYANSSNAGASAAYAAGSQMIILERTDSANQKIIINGSVTSAAQARTGRPANEAYGLARNAFGTPSNYSSDQLAMMFYGQSLGALESEFRAAILEYLTAVGAN